MEPNPNKIEPDYSEDIEDEIPLSEMDWGEIRRLLKKQHNIDDICSLFYDILAQKSVCKDIHCPIFPDLKKLNQRSLDFQYKTKDDARFEITDQEKLKLFEKEFDLFVSDAHDLFDLMVQTATTRQTKCDEENVYHKRNLEILDKILNSSHPVPVEMGKNIVTLMGFNSKMGEMSDELRHHNEDLEKKEEERERREKEKREKEKESKEA